MGFLLFNYAGLLFIYVFPGADFPSLPLGRPPVLILSDRPPDARDRLRRPDENPGVKRKKKAEAARKRKY